MIKKDRTKTKFGYVSLEVEYTSYINYNILTVVINRNTTCEYITCNFYGDDDIIKCYSNCLKQIRDYINSFSSGIIINGIFYDTKNITTREYMDLCKLKYRKKRKIKNE